VGWTDLLVFELVKGGTTVFKAASQFAALNFLLAGVLVESAFRDPEIFGSFRVLEPGVPGIPLERKRCRGWRLCRRLTSNSRQCSVQELNELLGVSRFENHAG